MNNNAMQDVVHGAIVIMVCGVVMFVYHMLNPYHEAEHHFQESHVALFYLMYVAYLIIVVAGVMSARRMVLGIVKM